MKALPKNLIIIINIVIAILCLVTVILHMLPAYTYEPTKADENTTCSDFKYAIAPSKQKAFKAYLTDEFMKRWNNEYYINDTIHGVVLNFVLSIATMVLCLVFRNKVGSVIMGGFLVANYLWVALFNRMLKLSSFYALYLIIAIVITLLWAFNLYLFIQRYKEKEAERAKTEQILY